MNNYKDFCKYVDVFYGNGEIDHFPSSGLASKWFYIKALCGNTTPHATYPFGKMSVGAYSGGYPTGYGTHYPNSCGGIKKLNNEMTIRGFSHLHQSGTGAIAYYYNYAITTPFYGSLSQITDYHKVEHESGKPGYYSATFNNIQCELTVNKHTALHHYTFLENGGRVAIDFSNNGLSKLFPENFYSFVKDAEMELVSDGCVFFSGIMSGVKLYFCVSVDAPKITGHLFNDTEEISDVKFTVQDNTKPFGAVFDFQGKDVNVKVSYSTQSYNHAQENILNSTDSFETTANNTYHAWNNHLSAIYIQTDNKELEEKFYSNFYHSITKPCDMTSEEIMGIKNELVADYATLWDQYKTLFPLIFMIYPEMSEKIVNSIGNISRTLGKIPCSLGLSNVFPCEEQAKMLGILTLCDAYHSGVMSANKDLISECIKRELAREDFKIFHEKGIFERYTHIIDTTDACLAVAEITDDVSLQKTLLNLAKNWKNAYDEDGLMSQNSKYYEGDRYTYSFRLQKNMEERIGLSGGKERFISLLDDFFGFNGESLQQITEMNAHHKISQIQQQYHRFEGFNNECDMETPYAYIYAGRHDRTCDIIHESVHKSFTTGKGALPGNNDSGGLSSCLMWNVLGIFPASGTGEFLLGCPQVNKSAIKLANGNLLEIECQIPSDIHYHIASVKFNDREITNFRIKTEDLMSGGKLVFETKPAQK